METLPPTLLRRIWQVWKQRKWFRLLRNREEEREMKNELCGDISWAKYKNNKVWLWGGQKQRPQHLESYWVMRQRVKEGETAAGETDPREIRERGRGLGVWVQMPPGLSARWPISKTDSHGFKIRIIARQARPYFRKFALSHILWNMFLPSLLGINFFTVSNASKARLA